MNLLYVTGIIGSGSRQLSRLLSAISILGVMSCQMGLSNGTALSMQEEEGLRDPAKDQEDKKEKKGKHSLKTVSPIL